MAESDPLENIMFPNEFLRQARLLVKQNNHDSAWVFRGLKLRNYRCDTGFARYLKQLGIRDLGMVGDWHSKLMQEIKLVSGKKGADDKSVWTFVQHFFRRTNLLDVTINPEMALRFACDTLDIIDDNPHINGNNPAICRVVAFKVHRGMFFAKQDNMPGGGGVSVLDYRENTIFKDPDVRDAFDNLRMERQDGLFLYCNQHFDPNNGRLFDFETYFKGDGSVGSLFRGHYIESGEFMSRKDNRSIPHPYGSEWRAERLSQIRPGKAYNAGIVRSFVIDLGSNRQSIPLFYLPEEIGDSIVRRIESVIRQKFLELENEIYNSCRI